MAKDDFNLDEELNNNLDFLDDNDLNSNPNNGYLSSNQSNSFNKMKLFTIITIIGVIFITIIIHLNKHHKHTNTLTTLPDKPSQITAPKTSHSTPSLTSTHQESNTHEINVPNINTHTQNTPIQQHIANDPPKQSTIIEHPNEKITWQDLKKNVAETTPPPEANNSTHNVTNTVNKNIETHAPVHGFEHQANPLAEQQIQAKAQENVNELKNNIENITRELISNAVQIKELQNNLKDISRSIGNVDSKILNLTNTIDTLSANVKKYTQDEDLDLIANIKPSEPDLFSSNTNTPEYVVHAVIPGRAWLKASSGQIITIAEGDSLGDYGKIALIDAVNNLVRTSSGVIFR